MFTSKGNMARQSTEFGKVQDRANALRAWLRENSPVCFVEQKHLEEGSQERVYWHYGYMVALRDVMRLMTGEPVSSDTPELGKSSSSSAV